jgi:hypothetical protein
MSLPKINRPLFDLPIPSKNKSVLSRPFLVKEEKILLMAMESGKEKDIVLALKQIVNLCIQEEGFNVNDLAIFDLEYMFLKLRSRSVSNIVSVTYEDTEDGKEYKFNIDLDDVQFMQIASIDNKIMLSDDIGLLMKWPSITIIDEMPDAMTSVEAVEYLITKCIDTIFDGEDVYPASDSTEEELKEFVDNLDINSFNKIREFFDSIPTMSYTIEYKNSLGNERKIELTTLSDFFTLA